MKKSSKDLRSFQEVDLIDEEDDEDNKIVLRPEKIQIPNKKAGMRLRKNLKPRMLHASLLKIVHSGTNIHFLS